MKRTLIIITIAAMFAACNDKDTKDKDMSMPEILEPQSGACPADCQHFDRGDTIHVCYLFTDDTELGAYNIEIHNNFSHHTHSTSDSECEHDEAKTPVNPWVFNHDYSIPEGMREFEARTDIVVPEDIDDGEYHFMIRLTDRAGWQQIKSVDIHINE
ncbi:MAG: DUF4625 domain-containing protein [Bacteroidales bacterium]|nr:DUF4625 domain-containing protein [Bacteroidales bacterium]